VGLLHGKRNGDHAALRASKPRARTDDLVVEELDDELLVYDGKTKRAHCLGVTAARVWRACDGETDVEALSVSLELSPDAVSQAIEELERTELLENQGLQVLNGSSANGNSNGNGITRRDLTRRSAQVGSAVIAAPLILSITAPTAAAAATPTPAVCFLYTTDNCGGSGGCGTITGCCCCCQAGGGPVPPSCKVCSAINFCNNGMLTCPKGDTGKCSNSSGGTPAGIGGCCSVSIPPPSGCGCQWSGTGSTSLFSCCDSRTGSACTTTDFCVPCCSGQPITVPNPGMPPYGCCSTTDTCPH